ncbi:GGDEF domain-containing protein [Alteromonas sp. CYL-A6]|uniref:GGDEF domain-containing protein n=1 Tax=Alteromonas nitratireducens TaxID=3390813 RepID=UPI0034ACEE46
MDHNTQLVMTTVVTLVMLLTMIGTYLVSRKEDCLVDWIGAAAAFFLNNLISLLYHFVTLPTLPTLLVVNLLFAMGHALLFSGVSRVTTGKPAYRVCFAATALFFAVHFYPGALESPALRIILSSPVVILLNLASIILLWRHRSSELKAAYITIMGIFGIYAFLYALRVAVLASGNITLSLHDNAALLSMYLVLAITFYFLITVSFAFLIALKKEMQLRLNAITDHLTGMLNRKTLDTLAEKTINQAARNNEHVAFIAIDIDHFKKINDNYGHDVGDAVIKKVSEAIKEETRDSDALFRLGGEEFLLLATLKQKEEASDLAERVRNNVFTRTFQVNSDEMSNISVSVGFATISGSAISWKEALKQADQALYKAKEKGRNQVIRWTQEALV